MPAFVGTMQYTDAQVAHEVHTLKTNAMLLSGARGWIPLTALLLGLVLLGLGVLLTRRGSSNEPADSGHGSGRPLVGV